MSMRMLASRFVEYGTGLNYFQTISFQRNDTASRFVGEQSDLLQTEIGKNLRPDAVLLKSGLHHIGSRMTGYRQRFRHRRNLVSANEYDNAPPLAPDNAHGFAQRIAAPPGCGQDVVEEIKRMHANKRWRRR